jgi:mono/diheme cytochrome c family protein
MANRRGKNFLVVAAAALAGAACGDGEFKEAMTLGGKTVSAETLNAGREAYRHNCYACHGMKGDGHGPSALGLRPPPRNFTEGVFKFGGVAAGELPNDEDLIRTVKRGLDGTPMLAWDIGDTERENIVQYIKTLSPKWKDEKPGERIVPTEDPWKGKEAEALEKGKKLYHVTARCATCHPHYIAPDALKGFYKELMEMDLTEFPPDMYRSQLRDTEYTVNGVVIKILPIDFLFHRVKNGTSLEELYRSIASGIGGTAMPMWRGSLPEEDLWALVHYVKSLVDLRDTPGGRALRKDLEAHPQPPPAPPAPEAPAPTTP